MRIDPEAAGYSSEEQKDPRTYAIIGAAMEVHRELGYGFLEAVYQDALELEFRLRGIPGKREVELPVNYKGQRLGASYKADFICFDSVVVEIKSVPKLTRLEEAQLINYLKVTGCETGLLLNFGRESLEFRRFALTKSAKSAKSAAKDRSKEN